MSAGLNRTSTLALVAAGVALCAGRTAGAADSPIPDRGQLTIAVGTGLGTGHLQASSVYGNAPVVYGGFELHVRVRAPVGVGVLLGGNDVTGWTLGANVRAEAHTSPRVFLSAGAGPAVATSGDLAALVLIAADATLSLRFTTNAALTVGPLLAVALTHEGKPGCGVDTCPAWAAPGDRLLVLRAGVGLAF